MLYELDALAKLAATLGLESRRVDSSRLEVVLGTAVLVFMNLLDEEDTLVGFEGTPWHSHGVVQFLTGADTYVECDEFGILRGLATGELVVVSQYLRGELNDRWISHKEEALDLSHIEAGEELRVLRLDAGPAPRQ